MTNIAMENPPMFKNGKPSITGPFSMAMLNNQRVNIYIYIILCIPCHEPFSTGLCRDIRDFSRRA